MPLLKLLELFSTSRISWSERKETIYFELLNENGGGVPFCFAYSSFNAGSLERKVSEWVYAELARRQFTRVSLMAIKGAFMSHILRKRGLRGIPHTVNVQRHFCNHPWNHLYSIVSPLKFVEKSRYLDYNGSFTRKLMIRLTNHYLGSDAWEAFDQSGCCSKWRKRVFSSKIATSTPSIDRNSA